MSLHHQPVRDNHESLATSGVFQRIACFGTSPIASDGECATVSYLNCHFSFSPSFAVPYPPGCKGSFLVLGRNGAHQNSDLASGTARQSKILDLLVVAEPDLHSPALLALSAP